MSLSGAILSRLDHDRLNPASLQLKCNAPIAATDVHEQTGWAKPIHHCGENLLAVPEPERHFLNFSELRLVCGGKGTCSLILAAQKRFSICLMSRAKL